MCTTKTYVINKKKGLKFLIINKTNLIYLLKINTGNISSCSFHIVDCDTRQSFPAYVYAL